MRRPAKFAGRRIFPVPARNILRAGTFFVRFSCHLLGQKKRAKPWTKKSGHTERKDNKDFFLFSVPLCFSCSSLRTLSLLFRSLRSFFTLSARPFSFFRRFRSSFPAFFRSSSLLLFRFLSDLPFPRKNFSHRMIVCRGAVFHKILNTYTRFSFKSFPLFKLTNLSGALFSIPLLTSRALSVTMSTVNTDNTVDTQNYGA